MIIFGLYQLLYIVHTYKNPFCNYQHAHVIFHPVNWRNPFSMRKRYKPVRNNQK